MKLLLHICCAPCTIYPLKALRAEAMEIQGYFYNPNIHPYQEYEKRRRTLEEYARICRLEVFYSERYDLEEFLEKSLPWGRERCRACYRIRLESTAREAKIKGFDAFSTTLLYSRFQKHDWIKAVGDEVAGHGQIPFLYRDFRQGWADGVRESKALGLYRQNYCGCIFSEKERFAPRPDQNKSDR